MPLPYPYRPARRYYTQGAPALPARVPSAAPLWAWADSVAAGAIAIAMRTAPQPITVAALRAQYRTLGPTPHTALAALESRLRGLSFVEAADYVSRARGATPRRPGREEPPPPPDEVPAPDVAPVVPEAVAPVAPVESGIPTAYVVAGGLAALAVVGYLLTRK